MSEKATYIKTLRGLLGLTVTEFAELAGTTPPSICNWEKGRNNPSDYAIGNLLKNLANSPADSCHMCLFPCGHTCCSYNHNNECRFYLVHERPPYYYHGSCKDAAIPILSNIGANNTAN